MATNGTDEGDDTEDDTGNSQFMPAIAVDPVTGEVAVSDYMRGTTPPTPASPRM